MISFSDIYLHILKNIINENINSLKIKDKNSQISILHNVYIFYFTETVARPLVGGILLFYFLSIHKMFYIKYIRNIILPS